MDKEAIYYKRQLFQSQLCIVDLAEKPENEARIDRYYKTHDDMMVKYLEDLKSGK